MNNLLRESDQIIDKYYPLHKLTRKEFKQIRKPWITNGILKSIKRKDELFRKYMNCKTQIIKIDIHSEYKTLKNHITTLIYISKKNYYTKYLSNTQMISKRYGKG